MTIALPGLIASLLYVISASIQLVALRHQRKSRRGLIIGLAGAGLLFHCFSLYHEIFTDRGINMAILPMISLMLLSIAAMLIISSLRRPVENLLIGVLPVAALAIITSLISDGEEIARTTLSEGFLVHVILSVIAYSLLAIAALQAALLSFGDYELRHRNLRIMKVMPPLQTMEGLLFELLWAGLIVLSASIATGFYYLSGKQDVPDGLVHHTVITLAAWVVFAILLWGRHQIGWRGQTASRWTISGFALLVLGYFGSKFVIEILLS